MRSIDRARFGERAGGAWSSGYARALLAAAPLGDVARAIARRLGRRRGLRFPPPASRADATAAAAAIASAPRLLCAPREARALYRLVLPGQRERTTARAEAILRGEIEIFGAVQQREHLLDWHRDARSGRRFDATAAAAEIDLLAPGLDPRGAWELARSAHLVELGVAAALEPDLAGAARRAIAHTIESFLDDNPIGRGIHWTAPLEVAVRAVNWLAAIDLVGGWTAAGRWGGRFLGRLGSALVAHGRFLAANLEDGGLVDGNHLLGDLVGLAAIGLRVGPAAEAGRWRAVALGRLGREAARQVERDGAHFEASTSYHRFALELLVAADRFAAAHGIDAGLGPTVDAMARYVTGYVDPAGGEPAFGDSDDGRCWPLVPRPPRDHGYLVSVAAMRTGDARLKLPGFPFSEEAVWLGGAAGYRRWRALETTAAPPVSSFPGGGVSVLRGGRDYAALRCGGYGQHGVGGHAHNDQLSVVVFLDGAPLVVDAGTYCYAADPVLRDRFRGTAAHSTVLVEAEEQSPLFDGRPFALPDGARARLVTIDEAHLGGEHRGYRRLAPGIRHERHVRMDRAAGAVLVEDRLWGSGEARVEARFHLGGARLRGGLDEEARGAAAALASRIGWPHVGEIDLDAALVFERLGGSPVVIAPLVGTPAPRLESGWWSPRYGVRIPCTIARVPARGLLPLGLAVAMFPLRGGTE